MSLGRLLTALALGSLTAIASPLGAQARACTAAAPWEMPIGKYAAPIAVREFGAGLLVLGTPSYSLRVAGDGTFAIADSGMAGYVFPRTRDPVLVPKPTESLAFVQPRIVSVRGQEADLLWTAPRGDIGDQSGTPTELWTGTWSRRGWREVRRIAQVLVLGLMDRQLTTDLIALGEDRVMAFIERDPVEGSGAITLLWRRNGRWTLERLDLAMLGASSVAIAEDRGELVLAFVAGSMDLMPPDGGSTTGVLWLSRHTARGWTTPRWIGGDGARFLSEPKLLRSGEDLLVSWTESRDPVGLKWRRLEADGRLGTIQALAGVVDVTQGEFPFRELLTTVSSDGTARLVRLRADGYSLISVVPSAGGFVPVVAGALRRPFALTVLVPEEKGQGPIRLVALDQRCALGADSRDPP
jgi:hypothetical protein